VEAIVSDTGELRTDRLVLQPLNMSDHAALLAHWTAPQVREFLFDGYVLSAAEITETIMASQRTFAYVGYGIWALRAAARHASVDSRLLGTPLLGTAGLRRLVEDDEDSEIEIVYSLDPSSWGHGYAAEAAEAVLRYAFDSVGLERVIAEIDEGNTASVALAEKLGMRPYETVPGQLGPMTHYMISSGSSG
jgi:RimJ/RimL family protein N-acetyltransferase